MAHAAQSTSAPASANLAPTPTWLDPLDGKADSGASTFSGPRSTTGPSTKITAWEPGSAGQAATLGTMDSYVGYAPGRLKADQGAIVFRYKPIPNLAATYAQRSPLWTDYGQYKPPQSGFLVDTIGWNAAPKGSFVFVLSPAAGGGLSWGVWDGSKWHNAVWTSPSEWQWDPSRWYEIAVTWGPGGMAILVDGEQKASLSDVVQVNNTIPWFLGQAPWSWPYGPHTMMGAYDEVRVYGEQIGPYVAATAKASPSAAPTVAPRVTATTPPPTSTKVPVQVAGATSVPTSQTATPRSGATPISGAPTTSAAPTPGTPAPSSQATPGPFKQIFGPMQSLPGGADGALADVMTTLDSANVVASLPGGAAGSVAQTVDKLPGGTALLCNLPLVLGGGLLLVLAALGGFAGGRRRRAPEPALATVARLGSVAVPPVTPPAPALEYSAPPMAPPVAPPASAHRPTTMPGSAGQTEPMAAPRPETLPGAPAPASSEFCDQCGKAVQRGAQFCDNCGARVTGG